MKSRLQNLFDKYNLSPKKFWGQNFLIESKPLSEIIQAANIKSTDNVLEVGPGLGFLTQKLLSRAKKVVAVEIDPGLHFVLKKELKNKENFTLLKADILEMDFAALSKNFVGQPYKIVANLPYQITAHFLKKYLSAGYHPDQMTLMVQREVAQRILAQAGRHSLLSLSVQFYCQPAWVAAVPAAAFFPKPKVDSAIIKLDKIQQIKMPVDEKLFFRMLKMAFSSKRKQLQNNLAAGLHCSKENIKKILSADNFGLKIRAQEIDLPDWLKIYNKLTAAGLLK
ncbi:MAG: 16S rRNA (adenine(1518)-N(6)/adenine(1519)-N(6))-dimethyltransferase RsmA [Patescibacteria group bacterium]